MIRVCLSFFASLVLFYAESLIVMNWAGFENGIHFADYKGLVVVLAMNFFLAFSIFTQIAPWFMKVNHIPADEDETHAHS